MDKNFKFLIPFLFSLSLSALNVPNWMLLCKNIIIYNVWHSLWPWDGHYTNLCCNYWHWLELKAMSSPSVVNSDMSQAFPECHVSKSLDWTQAVPTTGTSSKFFLLAEVFVPSKVIFCLALSSRHGINSFAFLKHSDTASAVGVRQPAAFPQPNWIVPY